jgi:hypothetical protein
MDSVHLAPGLSPPGDGKGFDSPILHRKPEPVNPPKASLLIDICLSKLDILN